MTQTVFNYENSAIRISIGDIIVYKEAIRNPKTGVAGLIGVAKQLRPVSACAPLNAGGVNLKLLAMALIAVKAVLAKWPTA